MIFPWVWDRGSGFASRRYQAAVAVKSMPAGTPFSAGTMLASGCRQRKKRTPAGVPFRAG
jgi:hypothetical protein